MKRILCLIFIGITLAAGQSSARETAASWIERGDGLVQQGVHAEAVTAYSEAITLDPHRADVYLKRGIARFAAKKTNGREALTDFTEAIRRAPTNAEAYYQRGIVNYYVINNEQGRKDLETAASLGHPEAIARLTAKDGTKKGEALAHPTIYFDYDKADITASYRPLLENVGEIMKKTFSAIMIAGHADSTGTDTYNQALSLRRAQAVKKFLTEHAGISPRRISVRACGEAMPVAPNDTEEGRAANRRAEIRGISDAPE